MRLLFFILLFWTQYSYADIIRHCCDCSTNYDSLIVELKRTSENLIKQPNNSKDYLKRGKIYFCLNMLDSASMDIKRCLSFDSNNAEALLRLGSIKYIKFMEKKSSPLTLTVDTVLYFVNKAIIVNPRYGEAYDFRGNIHFQNKDYTKAINDFSAAINFEVCCNPGSPYLGRCFSYLLIGKLDSAYIDYNSKSVSREELDRFDSNASQYFTDNLYDARMLYENLLNFKDGLYYKKDLVWCFGYYLRSLYEKEPDRKKTLGDIWH